VTIDNNFAKGQFIANGKKTLVYFNFHKEDEQWMIDLTSIFSFVSSAFKKMVDESKTKSKSIFIILNRNDNR